MKAKVICTYLFFVIPLLIFSQPENQLSFSYNYTGDLGRNFYGGIQKGNFYLGMMNFTAEAKFFKQGEFLIQVQNTHGNTPAKDYVGDLQVFSNIENGDYTYLYMLWYRHTFNNLTVLFGVHDLNSEFAYSELGALFTNSSFGIHPSLSWNMPVPIFPKNALGLVLNYELTEKFSLRTAIYDGDPGCLSEDKYNLDFSIDTKKEGLLSITEIQYSKGNQENQGSTYKLGLQYHSADFCNNSDSSRQRGNFGFYFIGDRFISRNLAVFTQLGWSPTCVSMNAFYSGLGIVYKDFGKAKNQSLGLAFSFANAGRNFCPVIQWPDKNFETTFEFFYQLKLNKNIIIQPDIQYIVNPGIFGSVNNALVGFARISINI